MFSIELNMHIIFLSTCDFLTTNLRLNIRKLSLLILAVTATVNKKYLLENLYNEAQKYKAKYNISNLTLKSDNTVKINTLKKKLSKLKDLYLEDLIDKSEYEHDYTKYKKELLELQSNFKEVQQKDFSKLNKILNSGIINIYNSLSREEKRRFWLSIIDKIYIEDNQIKKITFL